MIKQIRQHWLIIFFLIFYFAIVGYKFIYFKMPFYDWDEAIYAQVGREMVQKKSLVPLWQGQFWLDKPPLTPLAYGIVETIMPVEPEISTRFFTLFLSIIILVFTYILYLKITKDRYISFISVVITSFLPIFLQRAQVLNVDVFLLLGWLGYLNFFPNFWLSLFFLAVGITSKSLLGFYPPAMILFLKSYQLLTKQVKKKDYLNLIKKIIIQMGILSVWYLLMLFVFKNDFIKAHFLESHLKRVTASIESHFGKRTFYVDSLFEQLGIFKLLLPLGIFYIFWDFFKKKDFQKLFLSLFFVPWFIFLNLTKTKIAWYLYAVLPQFSFLVSYPVLLLKRYKYFYFLFTALLVIFVLNNNLKNNLFFKTQYSNYDQNYYLALKAKKNCQKLLILVDKNTRNTYSVLKEMDLVISTSNWWGNHPSIVYYFGKKVDFIYNTDDFIKNLNLLKIKECFVFYQEDVDQKTLSNYRFIDKIQELNLYQYQK